jgi:predicted transcriptional regulator
MSFKRWLRDHLEESNFTRVELAREAGFSIQALARWERGIHCPRGIHIKEICWVLFLSEVDRKDKELWDAQSKKVDNEYKRACALIAKEQQ